MRQHIIAARSKLKNFAPKISSCVQLTVLSVRNANIVFGGTAEELGFVTSCGTSFFRPFGFLLFFVFTPYLFCKILFASTMQVCHSFFE